MKVEISYKNLKKTDEIEGKIGSQSQKLEKFMGKFTQIKWHLDQKDGRFHIDVHLLGPRFEYHSCLDSKNLFSAIEKATIKLEKQVHRKKEKWKNTKKNTSIHNIDILEPEIAWTDYDEDNFDDVA